MEKKTPNKYNICLTYGTFDMFHFGHLSLLLRCKNQCNQLIVGVATDKYNKFKNKESFQSENQRFNFINMLPFVDKTIYEHNFSTQWKKDYKKYKANAIIMGDDHVGELDYLIKEGLNIIYLKRTTGISTTDIKEKLKCKKYSFFIQEKWIETKNIFNRINKNINKNDHFSILGISNKIEAHYELYQFWNNSKKVDLIFFFDDIEEINLLKRKINYWKKLKG
ncbi:Glycerol-3-phosphate cytidylyltransferase [Candidatus Hepatoplasma crinochetorum Av]|uniref:Glycerol-3-phosphate cytidylyltransferase n=1 Tax=Candidatus Hepatoplasma crinochetorum Av TaxID=1427984 RepID=W8GIV0_9MOLU|nr:adenylyltransferase/cytidyltransferase family protein [Candidatus Hepatoplasma crinochetorum]AHK22167.1 Glycerol-3-phosphate cytidylyltransferase [Candidatus Hepatoplasma crinochetorum Av]